jgi:zinc D-Ala-D-Ala carboxypeptidase
MSEHLKKEEFACKCCGKNEINDLFFSLLERAREISSVPFVINSGYRCAKHNSEVGGESDSAHLKGYAADIRTADSRTRFEVIKVVLSVGITRIGIGSDFVHVDTDPGKDLEVVWTYYPKK